MISKIEYLKMSEWYKKRLDEVASIIGGGTPNTGEPTYWNGEIPWLTPKDLSNYSNKFISKGQRQITAEGLENSSSRMLPKDSVLFTSRAPIGYVAIAQNPLCTNQGFTSLVLQKGYFSDFFSYLLQYNKKYIESISSVSTFSEISATPLGERITQLSLYANPCSTH